jgi:serine/threonine protein kinase
MTDGDSVLDYVVDRELGEGGMGKVFLASHTVLDQQVAIKVLDPEVARKPDVRERFIQEANIQARLRHPGIVQVLTATQIDGGAPALIMEYVSGKSLSEVLETRGALPIDDALKIMEQVLSAVGYAHRQGVIHRDLKPSNVMVMASGETKVTDFGIAKVLGSTKLTRTGTAMGSAHYMSPEQIRRPESVDARSDIYSLGCVFYEVLAGRPPFGEKDASGTESEFEVKTAHISIPVPILSAVKNNLPEWLVGLVMSMLEKEPHIRPVHCEAVLQIIRKHMRGTEDTSGSDFLAEPMLQPLATKASLNVSAVLEKNIDETKDAEEQKKIRAWQDQKRIAQLRSFEEEKKKREEQKNKQTEMQKKSSIKKVNDGSESINAVIAFLLVVSFVAVVYFLGS